MMKQIIVDNQVTPYYITDKGVEELNEIIEVWNNIKRGIDCIMED